jgi:hypothetical protein
MAKAKRVRSTPRKTAHKRNRAIRERNLRKTPTGRLESDGACSKAAIRRRIELIARERSLTSTDTANAMSCFTGHLLQFAERYGLSLDWLICGDLNGLLRTVRGDCQRERPTGGEAA